MKNMFNRGHIIAETDEYKKKFHLAVGNLLLSHDYEKREYGKKYILAWAHCIKTGMYPCVVCGQFFDKEDLEIISLGLWSLLGVENESPVCEQCYTDRKIEHLRMRLTRKYRRCKNCDDQWVNVENGNRKAAPLCSKECEFEYENAKKFRQLRASHKARNGDVDYEGLGGMTWKEWQLTLEYFNNSCSYCGNRNDKLILEHFRPATNKSGLFILRNIIPACSSCNLRKKNLDPYEYIEEFCDFDTQRKIVMWTTL